MGWRSEYSPKIGDLICILPSDNGKTECYDHLEGLPGIIVELEKVTQNNITRASVLIEDKIVKVWYPDLFYIR